MLRDGVPQRIVFQHIFLLGGHEGGEQESCIARSKHRGEILVSPARCFQTQKREKTVKVNLPRRSHMFHFLSFNCNIFGAAVEGGDVV